MKNQSLIVNWNYPTRILVGAGRINELAKACRELGMNAPLLVTDPGLASSLMVSKVIQQAQASGLRTGLFCQIKTNPTGDNVMNGVCAFKAGQHDGVIAFGGGSALDAGKAIALMVGQDRPLWDFEDVGDNWTRVNVSAMAPVLAIPTTAGTGSEVGRASVITDAEKQVKKIIFHPKMLPAMVILDPELTVGLPKLLTAATGMDALSHCLEAYCSNYYHPMAEGIALEGIRLIKENLIQAYKDGSDLEARTHMLVASAMGATAFQRGLGAMHALAHPLGAIYDIHHGRLNAVLMPYVLLANRSEIENKIERLANYLSIANGFDGFLDWIEQMRLELGIENTLSQLGIDHSQIDRLAKMATEDAAAASNTVLFTFEQYKELLSKAIGE
ncbi:TPA: iron-containing alcohol dehydrogenase [Legionella pneumophila]|uniref:Iron-containing alcohol dehydrogenase n=2 Tax=Legionella pneumophila TaxID=446 RepID=A0A3A6W5P6_LEGPN|nr:iron-containing alcohol dehydrogenase [Legionella pneumophila]ERH43964.1 alcohol dehydrogenase [Legionella pneumophila str. Leg01/11]ERH44168.1 alcohol dehydrogenase [Legionella pneumophila str. Leg01/53]ERI48863.1 alcohol dehydrogenase [Legionella pneumophila str. Leg01/20]ANN96220.1 alcohol dehydrogenase [Legionella pneumophila]ERB41659.1 alcohol dehydrogenase [Legionella pneumophila str. 121004]